MATNNEESVRLRRIMECSVCLETFTQPKCLPCVHTFCLKCLQGYGKAKVPGDETHCPMCRKAFQIPPGGFEQLPNNFLIEQLLETFGSKSSRLEDDRRDICETCSKEKAIKFCLECNQDLCQSCVELHGKYRAMQSHRIVTGEEKRNLVVNLPRSLYCEKHTDTQLELYCNVCHEIICTKCLHYGHSAHVASSVIQVSDVAKSDMKKASKTLEQFAAANKKELRELEINMENFLKQLSAHERAIKEKGEKVKSLVDSQVSQLLEQLENIKTERVKAIKTRKDEVERQLVILDSYQQYVDVMIANGTPGNIIRSSKDLIKRASEIVTSQKSFPEDKVGVEKVTFHEAVCQTTALRPTDLIGTLSTEDNSVKTLVVVGLNAGPKLAAQVLHVNLSRLDTVRTSFSIPTQMQGEAAACTYADSLYVVGIGACYRESWKYSSESNWKRLADLPGSRRGKHCVSAVQSKLYVLGGCDQDTVLDKVLSYNINYNTWSTVSQLIHAVQCAACVAYKDSIYVFGGWNKDDVAQTHVQVYNTLSNICELGPNAMPRPRYRMRAVLWQMSALLFNCNTCFIYNLESQTWQERKQFKTDLYYFALVLSQETVYIAGGGTFKKDNDNKDVWTCSDEVKSVSVMDIISDKPAVWKHHAKLPRPGLVDIYNSTPLRLQWKFPHNSWP